MKTLLSYSHETGEDADCYRVYLRSRPPIDRWGSAGPPFLCGGTPQGWPPWKLSTRS
jgi:hypothetical protein